MSRQNLPGVIRSARYHPAVMFLGISSIASDDRSSIPAPGARTGDVVGVADQKTSD